ncbi:MAG: serine hydrolase domain-containing protein [Bacteroidota bacterium]
MKKIAIVFSLLLIVATVVLLFSIKELPKTETKAPSPSNPYIDTLQMDLTQFFKQAKYKDSFVGAAVAVVMEDSIIFLKGFGRKSKDSIALIDQNSLFRIGSLSKGFAGILSGILVKEGHLNWDDKVKTYVPAFEVKDSSYTQLMSLRHILSHSGGFPYHTYTNLVEAGLSMEEIAASFDDIELVDAPGRLFSYQNAAFALSQEVLKKATSSSFDSLLYQYIFDPLEMERASCSYETIAQDSNIAFPHLRRATGWEQVPINQKYYNAIAAGGVNASITDMGQWLKALLGNNSDAISQEVLNEVFKTELTTKDVYRYYQKWPKHKESYYAKGWRVHTFSDTLNNRIDTLIHHGGYVNGYRSEIALDPSRKIGICVLFNCPSGFSRHVVPYIWEQSKLQRDSILEYMNPPL